PRSAFPHETQRGPPPAPSRPMQRQADDVALVAEAFYAVHQRPHQKEPATLLSGEILVQRTVDGALVEIEAGTFVDDFKDEVGVADDGAHTHMRAAGRAVSAQDGVRERFRQGDRNVQRAFGGGELELAAALPRELHYAFYVFNVAGDL